MERDSIVPQVLTQTRTFEPCNNVWKCCSRPSAAVQQSGGELETAAAQRAKTLWMMLALLGKKPFVLEKIALIRSSPIGRLCTKILA
jgi:hypothetical protein